MYGKSQFGHAMKLKAREFKKLSGLYKCDLPQIPSPNYKITKYPITI